MARQRKIIQIATCGVDNVQSTQCNSFLYALCDDGSLWGIANNDQEWFQVPSIPDAPDTMEGANLQTNNSGYTKCQCKVPSVPVGFTQVEKSSVKCTVCGGHFA